tara:strand:- start:1470 stop:1673 length:204 start_codon:yes stop_codon:yes gene_type:complete
MGKNILATLAIGIAIGFGWYKLWVEPHDEYREAIIECMNNDKVSVQLPSKSREAYDRCVAKLKEENK